MNLQQLRYLCAIADHGLNVSDAAEALFTSQPGVSKQVRQLEDELGVRVFVRAGQAPRVAHAGRRSRRRDRAARAAGDRQSQARRRGISRARTQARSPIATTHTQARYVLPPVHSRFRGALSEGEARCCIRAIPCRSPSRRASGDADRRHRHRGARDVRRARDAALLPMEPLRARAARRIRCAKASRSRSKRSRSYPIVTYDFAFTGRSQINAAFDAAGPQAQCRADRARFRRDQDLRRARHGRRHHRANGVRPAARQRVREARRRSPVRAVDHAARAPPRRVPARLSSTTSSPCSPPRSIARRSTRHCPAPRSRAAGRRNGDRKCSWA